MGNYSCVNGDGGKSPKEFCLAWEGDSYIMHHVFMYKHAHMAHITQKHTYFFLRGGGGGGGREDGEWYSVENYIFLFVNTTRQVPSIKKIVFICFIDFHDYRQDKFGTVETI